MLIFDAKNMHRLMNHHNSQLRRIRPPKPGHDPLDLRARDFTICVPPATRGVHADDMQHRSKNTVFQFRTEGPKVAWIGREKPQLEVEQGNVVDAGN